MTPACPPAPASLFMMYLIQGPPDCPRIRSLPSLPSWLRLSLGQSSRRGGGRSKTSGSPSGWGLGVARWGDDRLLIPSGWKETPRRPVEPPSPGHTASAVSSPSLRCSMLGVFKFSENHCLSVPCALCASQVYSLLATCEQLPCLRRAWPSGGPEAGGFAVTTRGRPSLGITWVV